MIEAPLETTRLYLREMRQSDVDDLMGIFGDPRVMASFNSPPFSQAQMESWLKRNLEHQDRNGYGLFSVILKESDRLIGNCGLENMEIGGELVAELGYDFRSDHWNQGYATEAASAVRDFAFNVLSLPCLISLIRVGNEASRRVSEKIGMRLKEEITRNGIAYWEYSIEGKSRIHVSNGLIC